MYAGPAPSLGPEEDMAQTACTTKVDKPTPASFRSDHHSIGEWSPLNGKEERGLAHLSRRRLRIRIIRARSWSTRSSSAMKTFDPRMVLRPLCKPFVKEIRSTTRTITDLALSLDKFHHTSGLCSRNSYLRNTLSTLHALASLHLQLWLVST
jgi:hypothetical protein